MLSNDKSPGLESEIVFKSNISLTHRGGFLFSFFLPNKPKERFWWLHLLTAFFPLLIPEHSWLPAHLFLSYTPSRIHPNIFLAEEFSDEKGAAKIGLRNKIGQSYFYQQLKRNKTFRTFLLY